MSEPRRSKLEWALALAGMGLSIFPLPEGKKRPHVRWKDVMSVDEGVIRSWFRDDPGMNYGACPGDGHVVLDLDVKGEKDGIEELRAVESEQGFDDWITGNTLTVRTPSGGLHHYLRIDHPVGNSDGLWPGGVDVRGSGGYVLGPGCAVGGNAYEVELDVPVATAPTWAVDRFRRRGETDPRRFDPIFEQDTQASVDSARGFLSNRRLAIEGHGGDEHTYATIVQVRDLSISEDKCLELLLEPGGWNDRCAPPWDPAELAIKVANGYRYATERPGAKGGALMEIHEEMTGATCEDVADRTDDRFEDLRKITFIGGQLLEGDEHQEMILPDLLPGHGLTAFLAKRGGGKTVIMTDMALRLACDMEWHGRPAAEGYHAVYICGEDDAGAREQIRAWLKDNMMDVPPDRFIFLAGVVDLMSVASTKLWTEYLYHLVGADGKAVVFVDTWQRASARGGQSSDEDMQLAVQHAEAMARSLRGPLVAAFHPPKTDERTVMGSTIIENSTVAIWTLQVELTARKMEVTRIKGPGLGDFTLFRFNKVGLGKDDQFGRERAGLVPVKVGGTEMSSEETAEFREGLREAIADVIRELDAWQKDRDPDTKNLSIKGVADTLVGFKDKSKVIDVAGNPTEEAEFAAQILAKLREAGMTGLSDKNLRNHLTAMFVTDPRGHDFGDGFKLVVTRDGNASRFLMKPTGM